MQLSQIKKDWTLIKKIKNPSEQICKAALSQNGNALRFIKNQTEEICRFAISSFPYALQHVKSQTPDLCNFALSVDLKSFVYIKNPVKSQILLAMKDPENFPYISKKNIDPMDPDFLKILNQMIDKNKITSGSIDTFPASFIPLEIYFKLLEKKDIYTISSIPRKLKTPEVISKILLTIEKTQPEEFNRLMENDSSYSLWINGAIFGAKNNTKFARLVREHQKTFLKSKIENL